LVDINVVPGQTTNTWAENLDIGRTLAEADGKIGHDGVSVSFGVAGVKT